MTAIALCGTASVSPRTAVGTSDGPRTGSGRTWIPIGPWGASVAVVAADPALNSIYVATEEGWLFKANGLFAPWSRLDLKLAHDDEVAGIAVNPSSPNTVYVLRHQGGVSASIDGGKSWIQKNSGLPGNYYASISTPGHPVLLMDPRAPNTLYANLDSYGLYKTVDGADHWARSTPEDLEGLYSVVLAPSAPDTLYAATYYGVWATRDGGQQWQRLPGLPHSTGSIAVHPDDPKRLVVSTRYKGLFATSDGGQTWRKTGPPPPDVRFTYMTFDPAFDDTLYGAAEWPGHGGVWKTTDEGLTWRRVHVQFDDERGDQRHFSILAGNPGWMLAGVSARLLASADRGDTWRTTDSGIRGSLRAASIVLSNSRPRTLYAGTEAGLLSTRDAGKHWSAAPRTSYVTVHATDPIHPRTVYAWIRSRLSRTDDGGQSWLSLDRRPLPIWESIWFVGINPVAPRTLYAGGLFTAKADTRPEDETEGLFRSTDGGTTWKMLEPYGARAIAIDPHQPSTLYVGGAGASPVSKSLDGGATWADVSRGLDGLDVKCMALNPIDTSVIYVGCADKGVYRSTDAGASWGRISTGLSKGTPRAIAIDPAKPTILYAAIDRAGVFESGDGGNTWRPAGEGLDTQTVRALVIDPDVPGVLYAGTEDQGVWMRGVTARTQ